MRDLFDMGRQFRKGVSMNARTLSDGEALNVPSLFQLWRPKTSYFAGQIVRRHSRYLFRVIQTHVSQIEWPPENAPALFRPVADPTVEFPPWVRPMGAHDAYGKGDRVSHGGRRWESAVDANIWEPGVHGWNEIASP